MRKNNKSNRGGYLSTQQVLERYGIRQRKTLDRWIKKNGFPKPIYITKRCRRWSIQELEKYDDGRKITVDDM